MYWKFDRSVSSNLDRKKSHTLYISKMAKVKCELEKTFVLENVQNKNMGYEVDEKLMKNYVYPLEKNMFLIQHSLKVLLFHKKSNP